MISQCIFLVVCSLSIQQEKNTLDISVTTQIDDVENVTEETSQIARLSDEENSSTKVIGRNRNASAESQQTKTQEKAESGIVRERVAPRASFVQLNGQELLSGFLAKGQELYSGWFGPDGESVNREYKGFDEKYINPSKAIDKERIDMFHISLIFMFLVLCCPVVWWCMSVRKEDKITRDQEKKDKIKNAMIARGVLAPDNAVAVGPPAAYDSKDLAYSQEAQYGDQSGYDEGYSQQQQGQYPQGQHAEGQGY